MHQASHESAETLSPRQITAKEKLTELARILARQAASEEVANAARDDRASITSNHENGDIQ